MQEINLILSALKHHLKANGLTYREVACRMSLSEASIKRLFATPRRFPLVYLLEMSALVGLSLSELIKEASARKVRIRFLSAAQEKELVSDITLLLVAVLALNHWNMNDMVQTYLLTEAQCLHALTRLSRLGLIVLLPQNRIRLNVDRDFDWLPYGPIRAFFKQNALPDFLDADFESKGEVIRFSHAMLTESAREKFLSEMTRLTHKLQDLHEESLLQPLEKRRGIGFLMATRTWEPEVFRQKRRSESFDSRRLGSEVPL